MSVKDSTANKPKKGKNKCNKQIVLPEEYPECASKDRTKAFQEMKHPVTKDTELHQ